MTDRILTLAQVAEERIVPLSKSSLYRAAEDGDGPFYKVRGRWMALESELRAWVREGAKGTRKAGRPKRAESETGALLAEVYALRDRAA